MHKFLYFLIPILASATMLFAEPETTLPIPTGPYQIGVTNFDLIDPSRKELEYPLGRLVPIQIYFPMQQGTHSPSKKIFEPRSPGNWPPLEIDVYSAKAEPSLLNAETTHPIILLNHGDTVAMTDYAFMAEDLASHGYVVVAIQHQLKTDPEEPRFWKERSISRYGKVINNILFVHEWLKAAQTSVFNERLDLNRVGFIGHSMGGNSLLLFANRASSTFKKKQSERLLAYENPEEVIEAIIVLDTGGFPYPSHNQFPLFLLLSEEREKYQKASGAYDQMTKIGHKVKYYKGSKHISFMDHGYVNPENPINPNEPYFNGSTEERKAFFDEIRYDVRLFLQENGITAIER